MTHPESGRDWLPLGFLIFGGAVGLFSLAALVLIRLELQEAGVQYLLTASGAPDGVLYNQLLALHGPTTVLYVMLPMLFAGLGYKFVPAALDRKKTKFRFLGWIGLTILCAGFVFLLLSIFDETSEPQALSIGRFLYPLVMDFAQERPAPSSLVLQAFLFTVLSLTLVLVDFLATFLAEGRRVFERNSVPAWAYCLAGVLIPLVPFMTLMPSELRGILSVWLGGYLNIHLSPIDLALIVVSIATIISSLWSSIRLERGYWVMPLSWALMFAAHFIYGRVVAQTLSRAGSVLNDLLFITGYSHALAHTASITALSGGLFAAFLPIARQLWLGMLQVSLMAVGSVITIVSFLSLGWQGMPRRYLDYAEAYEAWNKIASYGTYLTAFAMCLWIVILLRAVRWKEPDPLSAFD